MAMERSQPTGSSLNGIQPPLGSHCSFTASTQISSRPSQKSGSESPISAPPMAAWSCH